MVLCTVSSISIYCISLDLLINFVNIHRKNTPTTKNVINIPVELNAIAPIAQPDSSRKYCSGISWHFCLNRSGMVPALHVIHCVSSSGWRICERKIGEKKNEEKTNHNKCFIWFIALQLFEMKENTTISVYLDYFFCSLICFLFFLFIIIIDASHEINLYSTTQTRAV